MNDNKKRRLFIEVQGLRIAPDVVSTYFPVDKPENPTGLRFVFPNGRYIELNTTKEEQEKVLAMIDEIKKTKKI